MCFPESRHFTTAFELEEYRMEAKCLKYIRLEAGASTARHVPKLELGNEMNTA
jgi:hypothetical protein